MKFSCEGLRNSGVAKDCCHWKAQRLKHRTPGYYSSITPTDLKIPLSQEWGLVSTKIAYLHLNVLIHTCTNTLMKYNAYICLMFQTYYPLRLKAK